MLKLQNKEKLAVDNQKRKQLGTLGEASVAGTFHNDGDILIVFDGVMATSNIKRI